MATERLQEITRALRKRGEWTKTTFGMERGDPMCVAAADEIDRVRAELVAVRAERDGAEEFAKEGWAWVEEFCRLAGVADVFQLKEKLTASAASPVPGGPE